MKESLRNRLAALSPTQRQELLTRLRAAGQLPPEPRKLEPQDDLVLDADIMPKDRREPERLHDPEHVLVTGATGIVGVFLVAELLERTRAQIHCLIRADDRSHARDRLEATARRYRIAAVAQHPRVHVIVGDISKVRMGLSEPEHHRFADLIDVVYHAAAELNFLFDYETLRATNVQGTKHAIRLACAARASALHFVSTTFFFTLAHNERVSFHEDSSLELGERCVGGYGQTKWAAESLVHQAHDRGLSGSVFRPSLVLGHSKTGAANLDNIICRSIVGAVKMGAMLDQDFALDVVPVDFVSQALVALSLDPSVDGRTFHLTLPARLRLVDVMDALQARGYRIDRLSTRAWQAALPRGASGDADQEIAPLVPFFEQTWTTAGRQHSLFELLAAAAPIQCEHTLIALNGRVAIPPLDAVLRQTISYVESVTNLGAYKARG